MAYRRVMQSAFGVFLAFLILLAIGNLWLKVTSPVQVYKYGKYTPPKDESTATNKQPLLNTRKGNPPIELLVRTSTVNAAGKNLMQRSFCLLLRSLTLFWSPVFGKEVKFILDDESKTDHQFGEALGKIDFPLIRPVPLYEPILSNPKVFVDCPVSHNDFGYKRQLYSSFFMDKYSNSSVIGWLDSDVIFLTPATEEDIFDKDGRIIVYGFSATMDVSWVKSWFRTIEVATGYPGVADFMTVMFPEVFWRDTFANFRNFAMKRFHTDNFGDAYHEMCQSGHMSPVSILYNYAWQYERDRYHWVLDVSDKTFTKHFDVLYKHLLNISPSDIGVQRHIGYHAQEHEKDHMMAIEAYCQLKLRTGDAAPPICNQFKDKTHYALFGFSQFGVNLDHFCKGAENDKKCKEIADRNYARLVPFVKNGTFPLDRKHSKKIEEIAKSLKIKCQPYGL